MRKLIWFIIVIVGLYCGYWFVAASAIKTGAESWLADRRAENWQADAGVETKGFPLRFQTEFRDIQLADPETGLAWSAPSFVVQAKSYSPSYIKAIFADNQIFASPYEKLTLSSDSMIASVGFVPDTSLALDQSSVDVQNMKIVSSEGWQLHFESGQFTTIQSGGIAFAHDIDANLNSLVLDRRLRRKLDPAGLLPEQIETMQLDMTVTFDASWDRFAIERARPQPRLIDVGLVRANWGKLELLATGQVVVDENGVPEGRIDVKARHWREILGVAVQAGFLPGDIAPTIENAFEVLANLNGNPNTLDVPLTFQNGTILFGPIPLGPAPRIVIR